MLASWEEVESIKRNRAVPHVNSYETEERNTYPIWLFQGWSLPFSRAPQQQFRAAPRLQDKPALIYSQATGILTTLLCADLDRISTEHTGVSLIYKIHFPKSDFLVSYSTTTIHNLFLCSNGNANLYILIKFLFSNKVISIQ